MAPRKASYVGHCSAEDESERLSFNVQGLHCGPYIVDSSVWTLHCRFNSMDLTLWIQQYALHSVDRKLIPYTATWNVPVDCRTVASTAKVFHRVSRSSANSESEFQPQVAALIVCRSTSYSCSQICSFWTLGIRRISQHTLAAGFACQTLTTHSAASTLAIHSVHCEALSGSSLRHHSSFISPSFGYTLHSVSFEWRILNSVALFFRRSSVERLHSAIAEAWPTQR